MTSEPPLHLVIVGHVDHGKSTLIGRLLYDTGALSPERMEALREESRRRGRDVEFAHVMDHLAEERTDAMTIDTAQAFFCTARREVVIIDAPGHRELMRNMVTGATQAEAAVLVVDAAEGVREQTRRHAVFLGLLGIRQIAVFLNKMDRVDYSEPRYAALGREIGGLLGSLRLTPRFCIPGSAMRGDNVMMPSQAMPWYPGPTLGEALDAFECGTHENGAALRLPVQDAITLQKRPVVLGRVESGEVRLGQRLVFLPSGACASVASLCVLDEPRRRAGAGECVGLTLGPALSVPRGEVACPAESPAAPLRRWRATVFWMAPEPLRVGERIVARAATQEVPCRVERIEQRLDSATLALLEAEAPVLRETEIGSAVLAAERPMVLEPFHSVPELGRLVLTRGDAVVGGAIVGAAAAHDAAAGAPTT